MMGCAIAGGARRGNDGALSADAAIYFALFGSKRRSRAASPLERRDVLRSDGASGAEISLVAGSPVNAHNQLRLK